MEKDFIRGRLRGATPLFPKFPLSFEGEGDTGGEVEKMATDPSWLYSTIAQSSAAIVAIIGGFITASVLSLLSEKRSLLRQLNDKQNRTKYLDDLKEKLINERDTLEVQGYFDLIFEKLINKAKLPSIDEIKKEHETENLNQTILSKKYKNLCKQIDDARRIIRENMSSINENLDTEFEDWIKANNTKISSSDYEIIRRVYDNVRDKLKNEIEKRRRSNSILQDIPSIDYSSFLKIPLVNHELEAEKEKLGEKINECEYETSSLTNDVGNLSARIKSFSYPPNLGWGITVLGYLAVFSIVLPVIILSQEAFFSWAKWWTTSSFWLGIIGVFAYIVFQIRALRRQ